MKTPAGLLSFSFSFSFFSFALPPLLNQAGCCFLHRLQKETGAAWHADRTEAELRRSLMVQLRPAPGLRSGLFHEKKERERNRVMFLLFLLCFHCNKAAVQFINAQIYCRLSPPHTHPSPPPSCHQPMLMMPSPSAATPCTNSIALDGLKTTSFSTTASPLIII